MYRQSLVILFFALILSACNTAEPTATAVPPTNSPPPTNTPTEEPKPTATPTPSGPNLSAGLVAHYPFDGDSNDVSGNGNHGTVFGATLVEDRDGKPDSAYQFDGIDDYIEIPHSESVSLSFRATFSFWLYHQTQASGGFYSLIEKGDPERGGHSRYGMWLINDLVEICFQPTNNSFHNCLDSEFPLTAENWHHIVGTHDGQTTRLIINGQPAGEHTFSRDTISRSGFQLFIGADQYNDPIIYLKGILDDIRIYNRVLTDEELSILTE